jgi:hypothetical protein
MERLFSPCTRLHDLVESQGLFVPPEGLQELTLDVSTEDFLSTERAFAYADLYAILRNQDTVVWLTPHAAVAGEYGRVVHYRGQLDESYRFYFCVDSEEIFAMARSPEHLLEICDVVVRLLAASAVHSVYLHELSLDGVWINAASLAYLMEQCQSLKTLSLLNLDMDDDHCRVLGANSRPDLEIVFTGCTIKGAGSSMLAQVLGRDQGPTKLDRCDIDNIVLADGLRGNSSLKGLGTRVGANNREVLAIARALKENRGLVDLNLSNSSMSDETWGALCDSLKTHPTLEVLNLFSYPLYNSLITPAVLKSQIQAFVDMMKVNMSIHTIHLNSGYSQHEFFRGSVVPYLETNRLRPRLRAIQKSRPTAYRAKVLGRALLAARTDANSFWMLLSGNPEVALSSTTATTMPTATLTTHAPDAPTRAASTAGASAVANATTPTASCQMRKTCP